MYKMYFVNCNCFIRIYSSTARVYLMIKSVSVLSSVPIFNLFDEFLDSGGMFTSLEIDFNLSQSGLEHHLTRVEISLLDSLMTQSEKHNNPQC